jgi:leader peptidase (prepilin peptidase)/N-methyltransferase
MTARAFARRRWQAVPTWAVVTGTGLAAATVARRGLSADGFAWAAVQVVLVGISAYDLGTRRIGNVVTVPVSLLAVTLRAAFEHGALAQVVISGGEALLLFILLALLLHGGMGMGDAKLAGMLGFLLGWAVVRALLVGVVAGGVGAVVVLARTRATGATIAYGPYLAFGGMVAILAFNPPQLV